MTTKKTTSKADLSKSYVAALDTIIEGKPTHEGADVKVKGMTEERLQEYLDAGLLKEPESEEGEKKETDPADFKQLSKEASKVDTSGIKTTEK